MSGILRIPNRFCFHSTLWLMISAISVRYLLATVLSIGFAAHGLKKKSLSLSGSAAAIIVGFSSFAVSYRMGLILILFYYTSSKLTKVQEKVKAKLEDDYLHGGQRTAVQVLANSVLATVVAFIFSLYCGEDAALTLKPSGMLVSLYGYAADVDTLRTYLSCLYIAHYACATADTWASEVGILSKSNPRLVTSLFLRSVPPGTNGGMSLIGTIASAAGGSFIGLIYYAYDAIFIHSPNQSPIIYFGLYCGVLGSLLDSILGATLQASYYSQSRRCIVKSKPTKIENEDVRNICGIDILSNEAVNFISIALTMAIAAVSVPYFFSR